jgi:hypothetical protein
MPKPRSKTPKPAKGDGQMREGGVAMPSRRGLLVLSKFTIPPGTSTRITNHPTSTTSLWVDSGAVHLADDPDKHALAGGPIPMAHGPVVVTNSGASDAVVFAAMAEGGAAYAVFCPEEPGSTKVLATNLSADDAFDRAREHNFEHPGHNAAPRRQP